ncbi:MAG: Inner membrane protein YnjF [Chlamydiia bacterium]|nr:Inner membrane protein YnjF [Chlamydiia bacterium]
MLDALLQHTYEKHFISPAIKATGIKKVHPNLLTLAAAIIGILVWPLLAYDHRWIALGFVIGSGVLDTLDGAVSRASHRSSATGAALDLFSDRIVEFSIIMGLYMYEPSRAFITLMMLGSVLICITSFLIASQFSEAQSTKGKVKKSFTYSPGLIERSEAFILFSLMIGLPSLFTIFGWIFTGLVFTTAFIRMYQFAWQAKG